MAKYHHFTDVSGINDYRDRVDSRLRGVMKEKEKARFHGNMDDGCDKCGVLLAFDVLAFAIIIVDDAVMDAAVAEMLIVLDNVNIVSAVIVSVVANYKDSIK
ncbi:hypothetical protein BDF19DRAFT_416740 [Syncephalis fuscata]|nr:hypothetical protein BDF19DRAFT_416740 [Syncephalis fuscata]